MTQMTLINADKTNKICVNPRYPRHLRSPKTFDFSLLSCIFNC
jgi:hypothetical protein